MKIEREDIRSAVQEDLFQIRKSIDELVKEVEDLVKRVKKLDRWWK